MTVSWNEGKLRSYSNFFRRLIKIFLPGECLPNESKMEMMGAVIRRRVLPRKEPKPPASRGRGAPAPAGWGTVLPRGRRRGQTGIRQVILPLNHWQPKRSILKTPKRALSLCFSKFTELPPDRKFPASCDPRRGRGTAPAEGGEQRWRSSPLPRGEPPALLQRLRSHRRQRGHQPRGESFFN